MKYKSFKPKSNRGFTILELMVATSVFAVILIVLTVGVISFTNSYYRSVNQTKTQTTARNITNAIAQSIQFGRQIDPGDGGDTGLQYICADNTLYSYKINQEVVTNPQGPHQGRDGITRANTQGLCAGDQASLDQGKELLGQNMRLSDLTVSGGQDTNGLYTIRVRVVYGDDDSLTQTTDPSTEACKSGSGSQFCAISDLTTTVQSRFMDPNQ